MENNEVPARKGTTRRVFLSASAAGAVAAPLVSLAGTASAATTGAAAAAAASHWSGTASTLTCGL